MSLPSATDAGLLRAVASTVGRPVSAIDEVTRQPLDYDAFLAGRSLVRVRGVARTEGGRVAWSLIEKVTENPATASAYLYDNGLREARAYASGLLADLAPDVAAPAALAVAEHDADGRVVLWLEDLGERPAPLQPADVTAAARDLGRMAGRWLGRVPDRPWLFDGWIDRHGQPEAVAPALDRLRTVRDSRALASRLGWSVDDAISLIAEQDRIRERLEALPVTLCHHDAVGANVFRRAAGKGTETVLIDWEMIGPGSIGADLASLLFSSVRRGDLGMTTLDAVLADSVEAYSGGMADAGAPTDAVTLPRAFDAAVALRWTLFRDLALALDEGRDMRRGSRPQEPAEASMADLIGLSHLLLEAADRVRSSG